MKAGHHGVSGGHRIRLESPLRLTQTVHSTASPWVLRSAPRVPAGRSRRSPHKRPGRRSRSRHSQFRRTPPVPGAIRITLAIPCPRRIGAPATTEIISARRTRSSQQGRTTVCGTSATSRAPGSSARNQRRLAYHQSLGCHRHHGRRIVVDGCGSRCPQRSRIGAVRTAECVASCVSEGLLAAIRDTDAWPEVRRPGTTATARRPQRTPRRGPRRQSRLHSRRGRRARP